MNGHSTKRSRREFGAADRVVATALACVWLASGVAAIVLGVTHRTWVLLPLGLGAMAFCAMWVRVALTGRKVRWPRRTRGGRQAP